MTQVLLTGASGFVGQAACKRLGSEGLVVRPVYRSETKMPDSAGGVVVPCLDAETDWSAALQGIDVVVHAAARAHIMKNQELDPLAEFRRVNVFGTINLARQAAAAGVKRLVFISSVGVNGINTYGKAFTEDDEPCPKEPYALSKWEAENVLRDVAKETGLELVVIRSPLIYGLNAPGNFGRLVAAVRRGTLLPLGAVQNRRTLVALENLVDLVALCAHHPSAANQIFMAGDAEDVSTTVLLQRIGEAVGCTARLLPVPVSLMRAGAMLFGKVQLVDKICGDLQVDITKAKKLLGWSPPVDMKIAMCSYKKENS